MVGNCPGGELSGCGHRHHKTIIAVWLWKSFIRMVVMIARKCSHPQKINYLWQFRCLDFRHLPPSKLHVTGKYFLGVHKRTISLWYDIGFLKRCSLSNSLNQGCIISIIHWPSSDGQILTNFGDKYCHSHDMRNGATLWLWRRIDASSLYFVLFWLVHPFF